MSTTSLESPTKADAVGTNRFRPATIGVTILTAQLVAMIANGFTGLLTSLFQATGLAVAATVCR